MTENSNEQFQLNPMARMKARLRELNGRPHLPLNPQNRKLIRSDIREIYYFGTKSNKEEITRLKWR